MQAGIFSGLCYGVSNACSIRLVVGFDTMKERKETYFWQNEFSALFSLLSSSQIHGLHTRLNILGKQSNQGDEVEFIGKELQLKQTKRRTITTRTRRTIYN
jgi:hypothetical protein